MSLLKRDDQQPSYYIRAYRVFRYSLEDVLIAMVMALEAVCIAYAMVPWKETLTYAAIVAIVIIWLGGI